tara:strand:+ start:1356 stop:1982 length:627 start_codon:yes stop_codon:yes gene_type:complete
MEAGQTAGDYRAGQQRDVEEQPQVATFSATVKEKSEEDDGWHLALVIPALSQFPLDVYKVPAEAAEALKKGQSYNLALTRGALRAGKNAGMDFNYKWLWGGLDRSARPAQPDVDDEPERSSAPSTGKSQTYVPVQHGMADHPSKVAGFRMMRALEMARWYVSEVTQPFAISRNAESAPISAEEVLNISARFYAGIVAIEEDSHEDTED